MSAETFLTLKIIIVRSISRKWYLLSEDRRPLGGMVKKKPSGKGGKDDEDRGGLRGSWSGRVCISSYRGREALRF